MANILLMIQAYMHHSVIAFQQERTICAENILLLLVRQFHFRTMYQLEILESSGDRLTDLHQNISTKQGDGSMRSDKSPMYINHMHSRYPNRHCPWCYSACKWPILQLNYCR